MPPNNGTYIPTLAVRASEMNGLEFLPGVSKDRMTPVFLLAPWANSKSLEKTVERIERAYPKRRYFLDVDRDYIPSNSENSLAQTEWLAIRESSGQYKAWDDFWMRFKMAMPCLQLSDQEHDEIERQINHIQEQDREFCLRIEINRIPNNLQVAVETLSRLGTADFSVIVEGGWVADPLTLYARVEGLISGILSELDGRIPIAVSCTSMPKGFADIVGLAEAPFTNHQLLDQLRRSTNRDIILYGDWGSTRPREDGFGQAPYPRIDYPTDSSWCFARNRPREWDYGRAAQAVVASDAWNGQLGIWGEEMIQDTAYRPQFAIDTPQKNVASRVNIHLHRQALYGDNITDLNLDEPWVD